MSLGVLNNISANYAQNNLSGSQASLQKTLQQLSSGSRINSGADDAAGLSIANGLSANEAALTQSSANATDGVGLLQVADGALSQVTSLLNRAVTLATEAGNGTLNGSQLSAAQQEYGDILNEINTIGSSTTFNGNAVFSANATSIFTSDGTATGTTNYSVGSGTLNTTSGVGVTAPNSAATGLNSLPINTTVGAAAVTYASATADIYTLTPAGGSSTDTITGSSTNPFSIQVGSTNYAISVPTAGETLSALATQISTALGSSVASVGIVASTGVITITGKTGTANAVTLINAGYLEDTDPGGTTTAVTDAAAQTSSAANVVAANAAQSDTWQINAASTSDSFVNNGLKVVVGGNSTAVVFTGTGGVDTQTQLIADINTALNTAVGYSTGAAAGTGTTAPSTADIIVKASATGSANDFTLAGSVTDTLASPPSSVATAGIVLSGTDLNTNGDAATALTDVYQAISDVAYQRGAVGANINTLTAVSNVETTQNVNIASAQNSITATDYGAATSNLSKYEILSQTGISALAQANSVQQEVLKLLQ